MAEKDLSKADKLIIDILKKSDEPLSTYKIAKKAGISWATVNVHCMKLKYMRKIESSVKESKIGAKKKMWWLKK